MEIFKLNNDSLKNCLKLAPLALAVAFSSGCGSPDDPDEGTNISSSEVSGVAIDGYLAGATVYADLNDDGKRNPGEPYAETDGEGYFSTSKDGIDYCDIPATEHFCLRLSGAVPDSVTLRVYGGLDLYTSQSFVGELSATVSPGEDGTIGDEFITPVTSLLTGMESEEITTLLGNLGLDADQVGTDFLGSETVDQEVASIAYQLHKVAEIFAKVFENEDIYDFFGEESAFPRGASKLIYTALAEHLRGGGSLDSSGLSTVFDQVDQAIIDLYNNNLDEDESDEQITSEMSSEARSQAISNAASIINIIQAVVPQGETGLDAVTMRTRLTGVDMVASKMRDEDTGDQELAGLLDEALDGAEPGDLFDFLAAAEEINFRSLLDIEYAGNDIDYNSAEITGGITFENLGGQELSFNYSDSKDDGYSVSGAALVLFQALSGEGSDVVTASGELKLCLRYWDNEPERDEDNDEQFERDDDGELVYNPLNTEGLLFDAGDWKTVGTRTADLSILNGLKIKIVSKGEVATEEGTKNLLDFFYNEEGETWQTSNGLSAVDSSTVLESNEDCASALESRYGTLPNIN